tara:strand:- start:1511 stop:1774 length:264 start_codon:yes stop_codon:yes gene_type:complete
MNKEIFIQELLSKGWKPKPQSKRFSDLIGSKSIFTKTVLGFSSPLTWHCLEDRATQYISKRSGAEFLGTFKYSDGLGSLLNDKILKV